MNHQQLVPAVAAGGGGWVIAELLKAALVPLIHTFPHSVAPHSEPILGGPPSESELEHTVCDPSPCEPCEACIPTKAESIVVSIGTWVLDLPEPLFNYLIGILLGLAWWPFCDLVFVCRAKWRAAVRSWAGLPPRRVHFQNPLNDL